MRIGERLVREELITLKQLKEGLRAQGLSGGRLGTNLIELGFIDADALAQCLGRHYGMPVAREWHFELAEPALQTQLPADVAQRLLAVPLNRLQGAANHVAVAVMDPLPQDAIDELTKALSAHVVLVIAPEARLLASLERVYEAQRPDRFLVNGPKHEVLSLGALGEADVVCEMHICLEGEELVDDTADASEVILGSDYDDQVVVEEGAADADYVEEEAAPSSYEEDELIVAAEEDASALAAEDELVVAAEEEAAAEPVVAAEEEAADELVVAAEEEAADELVVAAEEEAADEPVVPVLPARPKMPAAGPPPLPLPARKPPGTEVASAGPPPIIARTKKAPELEILDDDDVELIDEDDIEDADDFDDVPTNVRDDFDDISTNVKEPPSLPMASSATPDRDELPGLPPIDDGLKIGAGEADEDLGVLGGDDDDLVFELDAPSFSAPPAEVEEAAAQAAEDLRQAIGEEPAVAMQTAAEESSALEMLATEMRDQDAHPADEEAAEPALTSGEALAEEAAEPAHLSAHEPESVSTEAAASDGETEGLEIQDQAEESAAELEAQANEPAAKMPSQEAEVDMLDLEDAGEDAPSEEAASSEAAGMSAEQAQAEDESAGAEQVEEESAGEEQAEEESAGEEQAEEESAGEEQAEEEQGAPGAQTINSRGEAHLARIPLKRINTQVTAAEAISGAPETYEDMLRAIRQANGRDRVGDLAMAALRDHFGELFEVGLLLVVRAPIAIGWKGYIRGGKEEAIRTVAIPLSRPSVLHDSYHKRQLIIGAPDAKGSEVNTHLWSILQVEPPSTVMVAPLVLAKQPVCMLYAQSAHSPQDVKTQAAEKLIALAKSTTNAFARLIRAAHR